MQLPSFLTHWVIGVGIVAALGAVPPATAIVLAKHSRPLDRATHTAGVCSDGATTFTLTSQLDNEPFAQTTFQLDSGATGQLWTITLTDNGTTYFDDLADTTTTQGTLTITTPNQSAFNTTHTIAAKAVNTANGTLCTGQVENNPPASHLK